MHGIEQGIIPRAEEFLRNVAKETIGPKLRYIYEEGLEAQRRGQEGLLVVKPKNARTFEPTTNADRNLDDLLRNRWQKEFPDIPWFSEDSKDRRLKGMSPVELRRQPVVMVVDIIDGTGRLARHSDRFSSSFALVMKGKPVLAVVYQPVRDILWTAEDGREGASRNDQQVYVSETTDLDKANITTAFAWDVKQRAENQKHLNRLVYFINQVMGTASSVLDGVDVAQGKVDAHVSFGLKPWDMAGFSFLVTKAGGKVTGLWRDDWTPFQPDILASNGLIHEDLKRIINRNFILAALMRIYRIQTRGDISKNRGLVYSTLQHIGKGIVFLNKMRNSGK